MTQATELKTLYRAVDQLRAGVDDVRRRYGDIPAVRRLVGDLDRINIDAHDLDNLPAPTPKEAPAIEYISDEPQDASMWAEADDEGVGGYHGGGSRR
jgi:hypothetical protein